MANFNIKTKSKQLNDDRFEIHLSVCVLTQIDIFVSDDIIVASRLAFQTLFFHTHSLSRCVCQIAALRLYVSYNCVLYMRTTFNVCVRMTVVILTFCKRLLYYWQKKLYYTSNEITNGCQMLKQAFVFVVFFFVCTTN